MLVSPQSVPEICFFFLSVNLFAELFHPGEILKYLYLNETHYKLRKLRNLGD